MVEVLFAGPFFEVETTRNGDIYRLGEKANEVWREIWGYLMETQMSLDWISTSIVLSVKFGQENIPHIIKINKWIQDQPEDLVVLCIRHGLLEEIFNVISIIKNNSTERESLTEFFLMIKCMLNMYKAHELKNSGNLMDIMLQNNFLFDPECSELCLTCISSLLRYQNDANYTKFGCLLKEVTDIQIKIQLLNSIQEILKDSATKRQCQESFLRAGTLGTLKEIITAEYLVDDHLISLWVSVLECVRFIIEENPACKKQLHEFDFGAVANTIRSSLYANVRSEIYLKSIESLLFILFETNNLGEPQVRNVKTPEVIPLVVELLSDCDRLGSAKEYFDHVSICLDDVYNAAHFANYRTTDLLLDALERSSSSFLLNFISKTLPLVICHHITPQELKKIIEIARYNSKNPQKQMLLYNCLSNAIKNSCCTTEHYKFGLNHTCLSPTRYFCFRESKSLLRCEVNPSETLLPPKEFSIFMWIYPDDLSQQCILSEILGPNFSRFIISINAGNIVVEYFQEKLTFVSISEETVVEKQWNLVGISLKSQAKYLFYSDKSDIEIFINSTKCNVKTDGKVARLKDNFFILTLGNSDNAQNGYKGRIISFFISKKALSHSHFKEIFYLSFQYNLGFSPDAISTSEDIKSDKSVLKLIFDNITFQWHPRGTSPETGIDKMEVKSECERFNGVTILESIAANGGLKIFLPLIKEWADNQGDNEGIVLILDIIAGVCIAQSVETILDKDFFNLLIFVLEESIEKMNVQLVDALIKIVGHLEWNEKHQAQALKSLFINKKLWRNLDDKDEESNSHYLGTLSLHIRRHFECNKETLYSIFDQLNVINKTYSDCFMEIWEKLIPNEIENQNLDGILILVFSMKDMDLTLLCNFLDMLSMKRLRRECFDSMIYSMLYLMEQIKDGNCQAAILKYVRKITEELCVEISKEINKRLAVSTRDEYEFITWLCSSIDKRLDKNILLDTFKELMMFYKCSLSTVEKKKSEKFVNFINIITRRLHACDCKRQMVSLISLEATDQEFAKVIFEQESFPQWLVSLYIEIPQEMEKIALVIFQKCAGIHNFNKLKVFLLSISQQFTGRGFSWSLHFFKKIMVDLKKCFFTPETYESGSGKSIAVHFLDFLGVLEDLLNVDFGVNEQIDLDIYIPILDLILNIGLEMQLISSTYPPLPQINFETQYNLLYEKPSFSFNDNAIYLREGGFLRLILKFIFVGLNVRQDRRLIEKLQIVLREGAPNANYLTLANEQKNRWEMRFSGANIERYTDCYMNLRERKDDVMYTTQFLTEYVIAECTEIIQSDGDNPILDFLKDFIRETEALTTIEKIKLPDSEIEWFYRLIKDHKFTVHSTARSRFNVQERNKNIDVLTQYPDLPTLPDSKNFISGIKEIFSRYRKEKDENNSLHNLLTSQNWITKVHFFLIALTSMKVNFISDCVKIPDQTVVSDIRINDELYEKINKMIVSKQESFRKFISVYDQKLDRSRRMADKKYQTFCKNVEKLKLILSGKTIGKFRIKRTLDGMGRMPFIERNSRVTEVVIPTSRLSIVFQKLPIPNFCSEMEETMDDSEIGGNDSDEEPIVVYAVIDEVERMDCERIKVNKAVFGFIEISQDYLLYISEGREKPKSELYFGSALEFASIVKKSEKVWEASDIQEVIPRRFIHRHTAFEIYLKSGESIYFNVFSEELCQKALNLMKFWGIKGVKVVKEPKKILEKHKKLWQKGAISNLEYLLLLNKFSSRSFNDISQYPIFPWVLRNYTSPELDFSDESIYRNLSLPIGAQTPEGRSEAKRKFSMFVDEDVVPFHYGSHYSSAGIVLHYLVRIDPFTDLAKSLQGGTFDVADRLFYSVESAWESGQGTTGDVKELVPEMYYLPEVLINLNKEEFGCRQEEFGVRQEELRVHDVDLPRWANSPVDFMIKHRKALESSYVSSHLHEWIDLVFGSKQGGLQAENSYNKFCSITYEDSYKKLRQKTIDLDTLQGYVEQIVHFGQTPMQLFKSSHPPRVKDMKSLDVYERWKQNPHSIELDWVQGQGHILSVVANSKSIWTVKALNNYLHLSRETSPDSKTSNKLEGVRDINLCEWEEAVQWKYSFGSSNAVLERGNLQYCLWGEDLLVSGFHIDNSFKIHTLNGGLYKSVHHHAGLVTCVSSTQDLLFTGSMDTSIVSWVATKDGVGPYQIYLGHSQAIRQLAVQGSYGVLLSLSIDGAVLVHEISSAQCLRKIQAERPIRLVAVSEQGLIAINVSGEGVRVLTLNGTEVTRHEQSREIRCMKFNKAGDILMYGVRNTFCFFEILEPGDVWERGMVDEESTGGNYEIETFCTTANEDYFTVVSRERNESKISTLGKIRDKKVMHPFNG